MKLSLFLFLLVLSNSCLAQYYSRAFDELKTCRTIQEVQATVRKLQRDVTEERISRSMGFGYHYTYYEFSLRPGNRLQNFRLYLVSENDTLRLAKLEGMHWRGHVSEKDFLVKDTKSIFEFLHQHHKVYKSSLTIKRFEKEITNQLTYTFGCGLDGSDYAKEARLMKKYVASSNQKKLLSWLRSTNTELQAYAATGLIQLKNQGLELGQEQQRALDHLTKLNPPVLTCAGCIYGLTRSVREVLGIDGND
ncbi:hypothetical protein [Pedobacter sp. SYSU D00535]|uniref:hypothetical protein n=1 Tax=Pedobacter sp. SYSU D00535 TaxID=2810308 RepID=UPI001A97B89B|nr:hypothetical protein [Pedobacter sp. SYSU D00535]